MPIIATQALTRRIKQTPHSSPSAADVDGQRVGGEKMNEDIKVGDGVYAHSVRDIYRYEVMRTTQTTIVIGRHDGEGEWITETLNRNLTRRGDKSRWPTWTYHRATPELDAQYEYHSLRERIKGRSLKRLTLDQLRRIVAIFDEETPPNAN